jgi:hypothetical protein
VLFSNDEDLLMSPRELLARYVSLPTILKFDQELSLIRGIQQIDRITIIRDIEVFVALISRVQESHTDNGIFEMDITNESYVINFYGWLQVLEAETGVDLLQYADGLNLTCNEIKKLMSKGN